MRQWQQQQNWQTSKHGCLMFHLNNRCYFHLYFSVNFVLLSVVCQIFLSFFVISFSTFYRLAKLFLLICRRVTSIIKYSFFVFFLCFFHLLWLRFMRVSSIASMLASFWFCISVFVVVFSCCSLFEYANY